MGSVTRRFKRNILAHKMATRAGLARYVPMIVYRAVMLRIKARHKKHSKDVHHEQQVVDSRKEKRTRKVRNEGSMVRRFFRGLLGKKGGRGR